jgi:uncharacterized protein (DUF885 family)
MAVKRVSNPTLRAYQALVERYFEETFAQFPEQGSAAGRHEFDAEFSRPGPATWLKHLKRVQTTLRALEDLPRGDFDAVTLLDRRAMLSILRSEAVNLGQLDHWRDNPQIHLHAAADAVLNMLVHHADNLLPVAPALIARLKAIPAFYSAAAECVRAPVPLWQTLTTNAAPGVGQLFLSLAGPLAQVTGRPLAGLQRIAKQAADAALDYARHVQRLTPAPAGSFALGENLFALRLREQTGLDWTPREAAAVGRARACQLAAELKQEARRFSAFKAPEEIIETARAQWQPGGTNLMQAYRHTTARVRERFESAGWMSFPKGEKLIMKAVPAFMRELIPTAAYSSPGPLDPNQTGIFWVNDPADAGLSPARTAAEVRQHFGLELTCAHEAYPGHHLQFIIQNRLPALARRMAQHAVYYEGWTLWCEQMAADLLMADPANDNPYLRLVQLHDELWRAWRIVIDVGLHTGELSYDAAVNILRREMGFTKARAQAEINWYSSMPTVPMSYLLGKMEVLRLKRQRVDSGAMTLRQFNDWLLSFGAIPWRWIEESGL